MYRVSWRHSPSQSLPDNLPINHRVAAEKRPKSQILNTGRGENENENPLKRPSLFDTRSRQSQSGNWPPFTPSPRHTRLTSSGKPDDIFLGPRISFASASAARQPKTPGGNGDSANGKDSKSYFDRFGAAKERGPRDRDSYRADQGSRNQEHNKPRFRVRRDSEGEGDRLARHRPRNLQLGEDDGKPIETPRRSAFDRSKFDQPWFRNDNKKSPTDADEGVRLNGDRGWRDRPRRNQNHVTSPTEQEPAWMKDNPASDNPEMPTTQEDFKRWREQMKMGKAKPNDKGAVEEKLTQTTEQASSGGSPQTAPTMDSSAPLFGLWGEATAEEKKAESKVSSAKPKASRFAGFFGPTAPSDPPPPHSAEELPSPAPAAAPAADHGPQISDEDQRGFQNIIQMLRLGSKSQEQSGNPFAPPPEPVHSPNGSIPGPRGSNESRNEARRVPQDQALGSPMDDAQAQRPPSAKRATTFEHQFPSQPPAPDRNSEFLLNLMKQHEPRTPFSEAQIYGQGYHRPKESADASAFSIHSRPPPQQPARPSYLENERAYAMNRNMETHMPDPHPRGESVSNTKSPEHEGFAPPPAPFAGSRVSSHTMSPQEFFNHQQQQHQFQQHPQPPQHSAPSSADRTTFPGHQQPPQFDRSRPPQWSDYGDGGPRQSRPHDGIPPPPGFPSAIQTRGMNGPNGPGGPPPGFYPFQQSQGAGPQQHQQPPNQHQPQSATAMRPPQLPYPPHNMGPEIPGPYGHPSQRPPGHSFNPGMHGPPPNFLPAMEHRHAGANGPPPRRPPSGHMPPGFDIFGPPSAGLNNGNGHGPGAGPGQGFNGYGGPPPGGRMMGGNMNGNGPGGMRGMNGFPPGMGVPQGPPPQQQHAHGGYAGYGGRGF